MRNKLVADYQEYSIEYLKTIGNEEENNASSTPATTTQTLIREGDPEEECR